MPLQSLPVLNTPSTSLPYPSGPLQKRHKGLAGFNDIEAWSYDDKELIAAAKTTWRSDVYDHYIVRVERWYDHRGEPSQLVLISAFERRYPNPASPTPEEQSVANAQISSDTSNSSTCAGTIDRRRILAARRHATSLNITGAAVQDTLNRDTIEAYLDTPTVPSGIVNQAGGVLGYWSAEHTNHPRIAQMALDYLTSPASSVDAERAFSGGRLMINHLQHRMSPQTFQAQMVIGSWFGTPLLPNIDSVASIIQDHM